MGWGQPLPIILAKGVISMPRRGDNIRKRKDGRWEARYPKVCYEEQSTKCGSVYGKTYQEAREKRDWIVQNQAYEQYQTKNFLFKEVLLAWQDSNRLRLKESSVCRYQNLIDTHILPKLGSIRVEHLNTTIINQFLLQKLESGRLDGSGGLSAAYVRSIALVITSAIQFGVTEHLCKPLNSSITKPLLSKKELNVLSRKSQEILEKTLLDAINEEKLLIFITLYTGLRIGEACALRWEDINLDARLIFVRHTVSRVWYHEGGKKHSKLIIGSPKTASSLRCIPICSKLYWVLCTFSQENRFGYILSNGDQTSFISPRTFEYRYKQILKKSGLAKINFHALRHTFATRCIECGVDLKTLCEILGHADASTTLNTYVHSSIEFKRHQLEKLAS